MRKLLSVLFQAMLISLIVSFSSCKKNNVRTVELDNSFALSLFSDTIVLDQLLNMMDPAVHQWINVDQNGDLYACYADTILNVVTADALMSGIDDISFDVESDFEIPDIPASPVEIPIDWTFDDLVSVPFAISGFSINSVVLESGRLTFDLTTDLSVVETVELTTENIILADGSNLKLVLDIENDDTNIDVNLENCEIFPENGAVVFSAKIGATISDEAVGGSYKFLLNGGLTDLSLKTIDGSIEDIEYDFSGVQDINFGIANLSGDFSLIKPLININYVNTFGFEAVAIIDSLYLKDESDNATSLIKNWKSMEIDLEPTGEEYNSLNNFTSLLVDEISLLNNYNQMRFGGNIVMSCDDMSEDMISKDSHIDVVAGIEIPMSFKMNELRYLDTIDFELALTDEGSEIFTLENPFDELKFKFIIANKLPIQIIPQLYMLSENEVIDSLFTNTLIHACFDNEPVEDILEISVVDEKIENVMASDHLILDLRFSTNGNVAMMNVEDYLKIKIGLKTKTTELTF